MSKKQSGWRETLVNSKTNTPTQKKGGKDLAAPTVPVSSGGKQAGSSMSKPSVSSGRSNSLSSRGSDLTASGSKVGGSLKRGSQAPRPASHPGRPAFRLCSSRSFSSLHAPSLTAAPFIRSSRSLSRLDQRSTGQESDHASPSSQAKKGQTENKGLNSRHSSSEEQIRVNKEQCHSDNAEELKASSSSELLESSSSLVSSSACHHHCNKVQKQELKRSVPDVSRSYLPRYRRLTSLECRGVEASATPDLLNFKKGWIMRQDASGQWQKDWFVLTDQILRFYKDSVAEEAADVDGEINLSTCFDITEYPAQKNCGFQIHTRDGVYTLCAMTSGMRHDWVQAVLKNVRPSLTPDITSSFSEQKTQQKSESAEVLWESENPNSCLQEHNTGDGAEDSPQQQKEQETELLPEREQSSAVGNSAPPPISPPHQVEEGNGAPCHRCPPPAGPTQTAGVPTASSCVEGAGSHVSTSTAVPSTDDCFDERSNAGNEIEQEVKTTPRSETQDASANTACERTEDKDALQTGQLVKELEQTQRELSRLQMLNRNLQDELRRERESHLRERVYPKSDHLSNSSEQALAVRRLQKMNHDLCTELEAQKRSQEEARETELRRRVDLLAQQAQLLVTGDATALAQAHLEQDRQRFHEHQKEWERRLTSLKSQLSASEEQRRGVESRLAQLQQELQSFQLVQQEAGRLQKHLQEVKAQLCANEEAQAQKEARLQKHLGLLQASQDRERRSLAASLAQAEQHSRDLQERLDRAEQQVESLSKTRTWTREIEEAQQQLQEELACTVSAVQNLQEEREQLDRRSQELQSQLSEADGEVSRLQSRLKTEETHYYNLEHSYERVSEELQLALGKVQRRESETQEMREGYERLLDGKEQELSEVLLKMEVLGNSLEETETRLNEVLRACDCASSRLRAESPEPARHDERLPTSEPPPANDSRPEEVDSEQLSGIGVARLNVDHSHERARSRSIDASYQSIVAAGDDPERFMSVIQLLESKLYATEEKLRDITRRLEEHRSHAGCQDPHLCSQLTQSRATSQHLSLLLHSQAKQSQRFAQETESRCRTLAGRFQVALNVAQACRERLHAAPINITDFERQLAAVAACLQQGQRDAERQQHDSHIAGKGEDKILNDETLAGADSGVSAKIKLANMSPAEDDIVSVRKCLMRELFVVEKMLSVLQSECGVGQLPLVQGEDEGDVAHRYKSIISQRIALKTEKRTECASGEPLVSAIARVCAEAELIYAALKFQKQYESLAHVNSQEEECKRKGLADINPPELAPYEEQVQVEGGGLEDAKPAEKVQSDDKEPEAKKGPEWLERLVSRLQRRAKFLQQLCQEISDGAVSERGEYDSAADVNWMQEQARLIYLSDRLQADLEQELQQSEVLQNRLQALRKQQDLTLTDEQEAFNHTLCQLQEDNGALREELERAERKIASAEAGNQRLLEDVQKIEDYHEERTQELEAKFQGKIRELQQIHEEEMKHLHGHYTKEKQAKGCAEAPAVSQSDSSPPDQAALERKTKEDHGIAAMEDTHRKLIGDLQQQHQTEVAALLKEKDQLLREETAATMAAIVAMRRAHRQELERSRQAQHIREGADFTQLHSEYEKEIQLLHKELEVLSLQHTQKCLENSQLSQELQDERNSLMQSQKENQELKKKQRETEEMSQLHLSLNGKQSQTNDFYEMEVVLRAREAEMQFLRQEARSLREELKIARMDKIYAQNKLKTLYANSRDEAHHDVNRVSDDLKLATWSPSSNASGQSLEDSMTNTSNAAFLKKTEKSSLLRQIRGLRSKSLKEGLSVQERMKLFESF